jgi:hypothetical protein
MSLTVTKVDVWATQIEDKPGGLAKLLGALAGAGANLECLIARRDPSNPGKGVAFLTPAKVLMSGRLLWQRALSLLKSLRP